MKKKQVRKSRDTAPLSYDLSYKEQLTKQPFSSISLFFNEIQHISN
jgi:hypothetical protein